MSKIEWTDSTWNPIVGCSRVSQGCRHCYAERMARRLAAMDGPTGEKYKGAITPKGDWSGSVWFDAPSYDLPSRVKKPTLWFVNSMSDTFHGSVSLNWLMRIWDVMKDNPQHTFQILTKRADRMSKLLASDGVITTTYGVLPNVWVGVSVENQDAADSRIPALLKAKAAVRFLSMEPLLGPVDLNAVIPGGISATDGPYVPGLHWVIVGGESGPGARPMHPDWVRSLRDQCTAATVPFFMKQWGEWLPNAQEYGCHQSEANYNRPHTLIGDVAMARVGKKAAGCLLDGREWKEMPK